MPQEQSVLVCLVKKSCPYHHHQEQESSRQDVERSKEEMAGRIKGNSESPSGKNMHQPNIQVNVGSKPVPPTYSAST